MTFKIQTLNPIAAIGLDKFDNNNYLIQQAIDNPDAILVRSHNMHNLTVASNLQVIGRAGAGTNTIPADEMTKLGIPVLNTPGANANAVKELVITGMLLACRHICRAWDYGRTLSGSDEELHTQVEKNKKQFSGMELPGKTLAVIGLGNIGVKVANAAVGLGMKVIGFDQRITVKNAWQLSSTIKQAHSLKEALAQADFISLHVPLLESTKNLINESYLRSIKPGAVLLNFARDGIVDNQALAEALSEKRLRNYVCDFINNTLKDHPDVICLPHLGASTKEAEENCAVMIAQQIQDFLKNGNIRHSVNFPDVNLPRSEGHRLAVINSNVPNVIAQISTVLSDAKINIIDMINKSREEIAYTLLDVNTLPDEDLLEKLRAIDGVIKARRV